MAQENSFQQVLINLATRFINQPVERMDEAVTEALRQVVELLGGLRAAINQIDEERKEIITLYEWRPPERGRMIPLRFPLPDADTLLPRLQRGEAITISNRDALPGDSELWHLLANAGIAAAAVVPIQVKGIFTGLYISTSWEEPGDIPPEMIDLLRVVGEIFLNAIERKQNEDQIRRLNADLEARVQARTQELQVSEERYRIVSQVISDYAFLCSVGPDGAITLEWMTQDSYSRLTGYPEEERAAAFSVYHPDDLQLAIDDTRRTIQGEPTERVYRIITKSGEVRWIYLRRYPLWDEQRVVRFYGVAQDITLRKRAEDEEREQRAVAEALLDIADALNGTLDLDDVLDRILTNVVRIAPDDVGTVLLIEGDTVRVARARGREMPGWKEAIENTQLPLATTPSLLHVYRTRQPLIIEDIEQYPDWVDVPVSRWIRAHACIPIQRDDEVIGFLTWEKAVPHSFAPKTIQVLQTFAHQAAIAITNARLYQQAQQLAVLQERQRLARDLHDAVTQTIFSASIIAQTVPLLWEEDPEAARKGMKQLHLLTRGAVAELRSLLLELRPEALENMTLPKLITQLADAFSGQTGIIPVLVMEGDRPLPQDVKMNLYRIAQEAFNNIIKHARASEMHTTLVMQDMVKLVIKDNGRGFSPQQQKSGSFGLKIMHERAEEIGAKLTIESEPGTQTILTVLWDEQNV